MKPTFANRLEPIYCAYLQAVVYFSQPICIIGVEYWSQPISIDLTAIYRVVGRSENPGMQILFGEHNLPPPAPPG